jgi:hypothetical protein
MAVNFLNGISIDGLQTQSSETTALVINGSDVVGTRELGSNAFNSTTIPTNNNQLTNGAGYINSLSGAVLTTTNQTIAGIKTFSSNTVFPGSDGGVEIGVWAQSSSYGFIGTAGMSGLEYAMIFDGTNTFVGAGTGGALKLRGPANDSSPSIVINGTTCTVDSGASVGQGDIRAKYRSSDNSAGVTGTFNIEENTALTIKDGIIVGIS